MTQHMAPPFQIPDGFCLDEVGSYGRMWMPKVQMVEETRQKRMRSVGGDEQEMEIEGGDGIAKKMKMALREAFLHHGKGYADHCFDEGARPPLHASPSTPMVACTLLQ